MALNAIQRLDLEDQLMTVFAHCINLDHEHKERMAQATLSEARALSDERLTAMVERLAVWVEAARAARAAATDGALTAPAEVG